MLNESQIKELIECAVNAREFSYSPYSKFKVGAALLTDKGKIYTGCNIENAAYSPTNCAERTAVFKAVSEGERSFTAIAIIGGSEYTYPCGVCRQVLREFAKPNDFYVIMVSGKDSTSYKLMTLSELLPESFGPADLKLEV